jgi:hypothetical protein
MSNTRTTRDQETREKDPIRYVYTPVSALPDPTPEPGYRFHWKAAAIIGQDNPTAMSQAFREGWVPVKADDHPELQVKGNKDGNVEIGGLILCKAPEEMVLARRDHFTRVSQQQVESVDNHYMKNNDPRMPLFNNKSTEVTRGRGFGNGSK